MPRRRDMERLQSEVEELFADLWQLPHFISGRGGFRPPVDCFVSPTRRQLVVVVDIAGVDPDRLTATVHDGELFVTGERRREREQGRVYQLMEIEDGAFERRIPLPAGIDVKAGEARYDLGQLTVTFPLAERRARSGKVLIRVAPR